MPKQKRHTLLTDDAVEPATCTTDHRLDILQRVPLFSRLTPAQLEHVNARFHAQDYTAGESIYRAGETAQHLCVVATGKVKLLRYSPVGQEVLLNILTPGDFFGSLATMGGEAYQENAVAQTACCILTLSASTFEDVLDAFPIVVRAALDLTAERLKEARDVIRQLSALPVEQRLAATLLKLAQKLGERHEEGLLLQVPLPQQDLAAMTGTTVETVNRVLVRFRRLGLLRSGRRWLVLTDVPKLMELAEGEALEDS